MTPEMKPDSDFFMNNTSKDDDYGFSVPELISLALSVPSIVLSIISLWLTGAFDWLFSIL